MGSFDMGVIFYVDSCFGTFDASLERWLCYHIACCLTVATAKAFMPVQLRRGSSTRVTSSLTVFNGNYHYGEKRLRKAVGMKIDSDDANPEMTL